MTYDEIDQLVETDPLALRDYCWHLQKQIDKLAKYVMEQVPGEPSQSEGAVDTAIRLLTR